MQALRVVAFAALSALLVVHAVPAPGIHERDSDTVTPLSSSQVSAFKPYSYYASAGYCEPSQTKNWSCGDNCDANPNFEPVASGGDGSVTQYWFVGYDPGLKTVIVSHQGTDTAAILPIITDGNFEQTNLDSSLFPGISSDIKVHSGFADAQSKAANDVLSAVEDAISKYGASSVTMVGHSLGAAISLLDSVFLPLHIQSAVTYTFTGYGLPRVGNQAFADYVDQSSVSVTHINNKEDPIPILPGMSLGFVHPSGEDHIEDSGTWVACSGHDNPSTDCTVGDVPTIFQGDESDHDGPYDGVEMGC